MMAANAAMVKINVVLRDNLLRACDDSIIPPEIPEIAIANCVTIHHLRSANSAMQLAAITEKAADLNPNFSLTLNRVHQPIRLQCLKRVSLFLH